MRDAETNWLLVYADSANKLITWLRSKTQILGIMRDVQEASGRIPLSVIRPVATRWTAYFLSYQRLLELSWVLRVMIQTPNHHDRMLMGKPASRAVAQKMIETINDGAFWLGLTKITKHLEPLARSSCLLQSVYTRLDQVPLVFGSLLWEYSMLKKDVLLSETIPMIEVIEKSIEKRWAACDQDVYIAAIILHPLIKMRPFRNILNRMDVWALISRLWKRFYPTQPASTLFKEFSDYLDSTGNFRGLDPYAQQIHTMAEELVGI
ncbi:hypothetical protein CPB83DRAFT_869389 [Crepidotus variabilis]|uniref:Uncharacterized protein n=1 Tax=Crepidotus variabilis TaxID=179855 RepID=A0A9P6E855_9AGAR|nr:hypothetical protein CPB83DRAFT_871281 [Crepidotus variabilis]KAF9528610.1 hypothetical protein CPB83DRAFT_869389 [Crepidotus variabilis]